MLWKGLSDVILPNPTAQANPPGAGCPGPYPSGFWVSPRRDSTTSPGNLCQCSVTRVLKMCFLMFRGKLCSCLWSLPFDLALGNCEGSVVPPSLPPHLRFLCTLIRSLSLLSSKLNSSSFLNLSTQEKFSNHFIIFVDLHWTLSSLSRPLVHGRIGHSTQEQRKISTYMFIIQFT